MANNNMPLVMAAESLIAQARRRDLEHFTKAASEAVFENQSLKQRLEEVSQLYNAQLQFINKMSSTQKLINDEVHNRITHPLQMENRQLKQQLFIEQAKLQLGIRKQEELEADLIMRYNAHFDATVKKIKDDFYAEEQKHFNDAVEKRAIEKMIQQNQFDQATLNDTATRVNAAAAQLKTRDNELQTSQDHLRTSEIHLNNTRAELATARADITTWRNNFDQLQAHCQTESTNRNNEVANLQNDLAGRDRDLVLFRQGMDHRDDEIDNLRNEINNLRITNAQQADRFNTLQNELP